MSEEFSLGLQLELDPNAISKIQENVKSIKIEPIQVTLDFKTANNQIKGLQSALKSLSTMKFDIGGQSGGSSNIESKTKAVSQTYKELISLQRQINGKQLKITSLDSQLDSKKILQYYQDIQKLKKAINDLGGAKALQGKELINFESLQSSTAVLNTVTNKVHQAEEAFKGSFNSSKMTQEISAIESKMNSLSTVSETTRSKFSELKTAQDTLNQSLSDKSSISTVVDNQARYNQILEETKASLKQDIDLEKQRIQQQRELAAATKLEAGRKDLSNQMAIWLKNNSAAAADFGGRIKQLQTELQNCDAVRLNGIKGEFKSIQQEAVLAGKTGQSLTEQIGSIGRAITTYFSAFKMITQAIRYLKEMYHNVYDINTAMTELKKVTEETESTYSNYFANAKEDAGEVSATISEYITATSNYARLGYNVPDSSELAKTALLYNNVGDDIQDVDDATESLISTMKGFNMEANESMQIVDKANDVGNNFAISSGGIGTALEKSAASLSAANNSLDESIGLITAANTIVQNPDIVGTAFKTLTMRIRGAESE